MNSNKANVVSKRWRLMPFGRNRLEQVFALALKHLHFGRLTVTFPSGNSSTWSGSQDSIDGQQFHAAIRINSYKSLQRMLQSQSVGLAESYIEQEWDSPDLTQLLELLACNMDALEPQIESLSFVKLWNRIQHVLRSNTKAGSKKNIAYHYDLGNGFYQQWLDESMTYSAALFDEEHQDLAAAQENKYRRLAEALELRAEHRVLEIGCGWGGFAEFAARNYGCHITCLTLSQEQYDFACERIEAAGLSDRVEIRFQDYRDVTGTFDRIVSIEMFEAVGEEHWAGYFSQVHDRLSANGKAGLQIITIEDSRFENYRTTPDFIQKYIFPGGMLPSPARLREEVARADMTLDDEFMFGASYARTLELWRRDFLRNWSAISMLGYSARFRRLWEYYLCYCEAGFRRDTIDVGHFIISKKDADTKA